jgi:hypothetical protein
VPSFVANACYRNGLKFRPSFLTPEEYFQHQKGDPLYEYKVDNEEEVDDDDPFQEEEDDDDHFFNNYNELGYCVEVSVIRNIFRITVDLEPAGEGEFHLVERKHCRGAFFEHCETAYLDAPSIFFDDKGNARLQSMKTAMKKDKRYLMFISEFKLMEEYRHSTWVGACALRMVMTQGMLKDKWAVAMYIPRAHWQFVSDDEEMNSKLDPGEDEAWDKRDQILLDLDMRQVLRAGFRQVKDAGPEARLQYLYAVPSFLKPCILTHQEAMCLPIFHEPPLGCKKPQGKDAELLGCVSCNFIQIEHQEQCIASLDSPRTKNEFEQSAFREVIRSCGIHELLEEESNASPLGQRHSALKSRIAELESEQSTRNSSNKRPRDEENIEQLARDCSRLNAELKDDMETRVQATFLLQSTLV